MDYQTNEKSRDKLFKTIRLEDKSAVEIDRTF